MREREKERERGVVCAKKIFLHCAIRMRMNDNKIVCTKEIRRNIRSH